MRPTLLIRVVWDGAYVNSLREHSTPRRALAGVQGWREVAGWRRNPTMGNTRYSLCSGTSIGIPGR